VRRVVVLAVLLAGLPSTVVVLPRVAAVSPSFMSPRIVSRSQKLAMSLASWPLAAILVHFPASMSTAASVSSLDSSLWARRNFSSYFM
jgi:hypothetical protein